MVSNVMFSSKEESWATPQDFFDKLNDEFHFTLDPCADEQNHKCARYYTKEQDGLKQDWSGEVVFCNPPSAVPFHGRDFQRSGVVSRWPTKSSG